MNAICTGRNAPCPCGSGKRYKDCHGAISLSSTPFSSEACEPSSAGPEAHHDDARSGYAVFSQDRAVYRPTGSDWAHLDEAEQRTCGLMMQRALKRQRAGKLAEAASYYEQVLARAPDTHDALHMLGAIELRRGKLAEAKELIVAALRLRPSYPDIEHNLRMVEDLQRAEQVGAGRPSTPAETLCEKALPILVDLALRAPRLARRSDPSEDPPPQSDLPIHLIGGVLPSTDDGAWLLRRLGALLAPERPTVWTADPEGGMAPSSQRLPAVAGDLPRDGCHVFVGIDVDCAHWIDRSDAKRIIVFCQPAPPSQYLHQLRAISRDGARAIELVFPSQSMAARFGPGHVVISPPIASDAVLVDRTSPAISAVAAPFGIGLIGRHWQGISPSSDTAFLGRVGTMAGTLEIYDPGPLRYLIGADPSVRCTTRGAAYLRRFLRSVECLLHVAGDWWREGDGRELFMAMAAGVPIVCPRASIFAEYITHGEDGLLYDEREEALLHIEDLRRTPSRRVALGQAARAMVAQRVANERSAVEIRRLILGEACTPETSVSGAKRGLVATK